MKDKLDKETKEVLDQQKKIKELTQHEGWALAKAALTKKIASLLMLGDVAAGDPTAVTIIVGVAVQIVKFQASGKFTDPHSVKFRVKILAKRVLAKGVVVIGNTRIIKQVLELVAREHGPIAHIHVIAGPVTVHFFVKTADLIEGVLGCRAAVDFPAIPQGFCILVGPPIPFRRRIEVEIIHLAYRSREEGSGELLIRVPKLLEVVRTNLNPVLKGDDEFT